MILKCKNYNLVVNRDWLQFSGQLKLAKGESITDPEVMCPDGYRMEILSGTNVFNYRATIHDMRGTKVLTVLWSPKARWLNRRMIMFEVANQMLYDCELNRLLDLTYEIHDYTFLCISRLDLCCDFDVTKRQRQVITKLYKGKCYVASKGEGSVFWSKNADEIYPHCLSYGSKKSDFKWKLYNKSKELGIGTQTPDKTYIWEEWQAAGMNITNVWRLEVSITKGSGFKVETHSLDLQDALSDAYMLGIYADLLKKRFIVRKSQGHTRKSNDEEIDFLGFPDIAKNTSTIKYESKSTDPQVGTIINKMCDVLESNEVQSSPMLFKQMSVTLMGMVAKYNLTSYFFQSKGMSVQSYLRTLDGMRKSTIVDRRGGVDYSMIGDGINSCWLRKKWMSVQMAKKSMVDV